MTATLELVSSLIGSFLCILKIKRTDLLGVWDYGVATMMNKSTKANTLKLLLNFAFIAALYLSVRYAAHT